MQVNFPKLVLNKYSFRNLVIMLSLAALFYFVGNYTILSSVIYVLSCVFIVATFLVIYRWKMYITYLNQIGEKTNRDRFVKGTHIVSMVPFKNLQIALHVRLDDSALLVKKANCYRAIDLNKIDSFEPVEYFGHPIVKVILIDPKELLYPLYVPWSEEMSQHEFFVNGI